ncbi:hypothetical protein SDC9_157389 [bioreactor metagenome]|uniref:Uncharacterized protein n=1 Tax=bioreactor metagenome TaxID=1076179 RepID=A0A645F902_9ZZZZ
MFSRLQPFDNHFQPFEFGKKIRFIINQRIGCAQICQQLSRTITHAFGTNGQTDSGQYIIYANSAQISTFPGHIGSGNNHKKRFLNDIYIVSNAFMARDERVPQLFCPERNGVLKRGKCIIGIICGKCAQRNKRINLRQCRKPFPDLHSIVLHPFFYLQGINNIPQKKRVQEKKNRNSKSQIEVPAILCQLLYGR